MLARLLAHQTHRPFPDFRGVSRRCLHRSILSRNGASEKSGAVQARCTRRSEPTEARRLLERLEIHYTPKHGSWFDVAEIELSVFTKQCLARRIDNIDTLRREGKAWADARNAAQTGVDWQFTNEQARIKLKHWYPQVTLNEVLVPTDTKLASLADVAAVYLGLPKVVDDFPENEKLTTVDSFTAHEQVIKGTRFQIRRNSETFTESALNLCYPGHKDEEPLLAEFTLKYEDAEEGYSVKMSRRAYGGVFAAIQSQPGGWVSAKSPRPRRPTSTSLKD